MIILGNPSQLHSQDLLAVEGLCPTLARCVTQMDDEIRILREARHALVVLKHNALSNQSVTPLSSFEIVPI